MIELGISENEIIEECRSKDTSENARYAKQIIDPQITQINADLKMKDQRTYKIIGAALEVQSADFAPEK